MVIFFHLNRDLDVCNCLFSDYVVLTLTIGYAVAQIQAILQPVSASRYAPIIYAEFFDFSNLYHTTVNDVRVATPAPDIEMFLVRQRLRSNNMPLGDIIPLDSVCQVIQLIPKFGVEVSGMMMGDNCLHVGREFYINSFADKETFHAILSYQ